MPLPKPRDGGRLNEGATLPEPRTPDFVVFAIDPEISDQAHIERHLRACISAVTVRELRRRGLLNANP
jgi:hypothetical protein